MRSTRAWATLGALVVLTAGCQAQGDTPSTEADAAAGARAATDVQYVAMGDSYVAAPGLPQNDVAGGCFRSDRDYPSLLAASQGLDLVDVSCSGATTADVTEAQYGEIAPQIDALSDDTDLVTIGIGGNDAGLFTEVFTACARAADDAAPPCSETFGAGADRALAEIRANVDAAVGAIVEAAPGARVLVVGYPQIVPASGQCDALLPLTERDYPFISGVNRGLTEALRLAARSQGVEYVDVFAASAGHDVCSDEPWVNGNETAPDGTIPLHPLGAGTEGVAALIAEVL